MQVITIDWDELDDYVKKYGDLIKHIIPYQIVCSDVNGGRKFKLVVSEN